jgi:ABC-type multidrug transport system ATPase subunit
MATPAEGPQHGGPVNISVEQLRHVYKGGTVALDGVDLSFGTGLFGLLGPNGAGKSTLMRIMCTLLVPTAGRVTVGGHDVVRERRAVRQMLGYLPQEFGAWRLHRVEEVLDTLALLSGMSDKAQRRERVAKVLEEVGLQNVADRKVKKLSGGMVRRLGVAQALVHEPSVLIVDEPTVGLDPQERLRFRQLMASLGQERTIVLSTHIVADLGSSCSDMALIDEGEIVYRGSPSELVAKANVFELIVEAASERELAQGYEVVSRTKENGNTCIRAVSGDGRTPEGARLVEKPTLEEAYLSFMAARGKVEAALAEEDES